jgi:tRNA (cytidine/uridine-2'-O-)-methyltransferase
MLGLAARRPAAGRALAGRAQCLARRAGATVSESATDSGRRVVARPIPPPASGRRPRLAAAAATTPGQSPSPTTAATTPPWATPADDDTGTDPHAWLRTDLALVLVTPRIPHNTGATARTAAAAGVPLHIVGPAGFSLADRDLKRAGLDYWRAVAVAYHEDWDAFMASLDRPSARLVAFSKFGTTHHAAPGLYAPPAVPGGRTWLLFGAETSGLPPAAHAAADAVVRVPILTHAVRSLNLAVSAGVGVFEALRQLDGPVFSDETRV